MLEFLYLVSLTRKGKQRAQEEEIIPVHCAASDLRFAQNSLFRPDEKERDTGNRDGMGGPRGIGGRRKEDNVYS